MKLIIVILLFIVNLSASDYEDHDDNHIDKELSHLSLNKMQNKKITIYLKVFRNDLKEYRKDKKIIENSRSKEFMRKKLDINKLNKLNSIIDTKARNIENKLLKNIHGILSYEQKVKFVKYFDDWKVR